MAKGKSLTKEEELLLQDFSRDVSKKSSLLFYGNALLVAVLPLCKFKIESSLPDIIDKSSFELTKLLFTIH